MKHHWKLLVMLLILASYQASGQVKKDILGAWHLEDGRQEHILIFQDGYVTHTVYSGNTFLFSHGGIFQQSDDGIDIQIEYNSENKAEVGMQLMLPARIEDDQLDITFEGMPTLWTRLDNSSAPLAGVWQITDRMEEGKTVPIQRSGTRKTLKILTGTRFQWVAMDPAVGSFSGTGGGTYTFKDGKYTENIDFFSRDNGRVGASLVFDAHLENEKWHHSGLSSKGDKIYEIWGKSH